MIIIGTSIVAARAVYYYGQDNVSYVVTNEVKKVGKSLNKKKIYHISKLKEESNNEKVIIAVFDYEYQDIINLLNEYGINNYEMFSQERIFSYCNINDSEDVILYHILHDVDGIFYIDVGCNDPYYHSVTKLLYDRKRAHGINIDPVQSYINMYQYERKDDINLCYAIGSESSACKKIYFQGGLTTFIPEYVLEDKPKREFTIPVTTLAEVCRQYVKNDQEIHFLKIDVEGYEEQVLLGADFLTYRPWIVIIEAKNPKNGDNTYYRCEEMLKSYGYDLAASYGVNRYYVSNEKSEYISSFRELKDLKYKYKIEYVCPN